MSGMAFRFMECLTFHNSRRPSESHNSRRPSESLLLIKRASPLEATESLTKDLEIWPETSILPKPSFS